MKSILFDTETSGFKSNYIIQLAYIIFDEDRVIEEKNLKFDIPANIEIEEGASNIHGIYKKDLEGCPFFKDFIEIFIKKLYVCDEIVAHNASFDLRMLKNEAVRNFCLINWDNINQKVCCTMKNTTQLLKLPRKNGGLKFPKLQELHRFLFKENFEDAHDALADVRATLKCYRELKKRKHL